MTPLLLIVAVVLIVIVAFVIWWRHEPVPLIKAIRRGNTSLAIELIKNGADVNVKNSIGEAPLHHAASNGSLEIARLLLERGAEVEPQTVTGHDSPLIRATGRHNADLVRLLVDSGANIHRCDWNENTPLLSSIIIGEDRAVEALIDAGSDVNARNRNGDSAIWLAICHDRNEILGKLIRAGASLEKIGNQNLNALESCITTQRYSMAADYFDEFVAAGVKPNTTHAEYSTLQLAVSCALREEIKPDHPLVTVIRKIVAAGADTNLSRGIVAQHYAPEFFDAYKTRILDLLDGN